MEGENAAETSRLRSGQGYLKASTASSIILSEARRASISGLRRARNLRPLPLTAKESFNSALAAARRSLRSVARDTSAQPLYENVRQKDGKEEGGEGDGRESAPQAAGAMLLLEERSALRHALAVARAHCPSLYAQKRREERGDEDREEEERKQSKARATTASTSSPLLFQAEVEEGNAPVTRDGEWQRLSWKRPSLMRELEAQETMSAEERAALELAEAKRRKKNPGRYQYNLATAAAAVAAAMPQPNDTSRTVTPSARLGAGGRGREPFSLASPRFPSRSTPLSTALSRAHVQGRGQRQRGESGLTREQQSQQQQRRPRVEQERPPASCEEAQSVAETLLRRTLTASGQLDRVAARVELALHAAVNGRPADVKPLLMRVLVSTSQSGGGAASAASVDATLASGLLTGQPETRAPPLEGPAGRLRLAAAAYSAALALVASNNSAETERDALREAIVHLQRTQTGADGAHQAQTLGQGDTQAQMDAGARAPASASLGDGDEALFLLWLAEQELAAEHGQVGLSEVVARLAPVMQHGSGAPEVAAFRLALRPLQTSTGRTLHLLRQFAAHNPAHPVTAAAVPGLLAPALEHVGAAVAAVDALEATAAVAELGECDEGQQARNWLALLEAVALCQQTDRSFRAASASVASVSAASVSAVSASALASAPTATFADVVINIFHKADSPYAWWPRYFAVVPHHTDYSAWKRQPALAVLIARAACLARIWPAVSEGSLQATENAEPQKRNALNPVEPWELAALMVSRLTSILHDMHEEGVAAALQRLGDGTTTLPAPEDVAAIADLVQRWAGPTDPEADAILRLGRTAEDAYDGTRGSSFPTNSQAGMSLVRNLGSLDSDSESSDTSREPSPAAGAASAPALPLTRAKAAAKAAATTPSVDGSRSPTPPLNFLDFSSDSD